MSNKVTVMGNIVKDVEFVTTDSGRKFASFTVADSSFFKDDKSGEWVSARDTIFWNVTAGDGLDTTVKSVVSKLKKGDPVEVVGRVTKVDGFISKQQTVYVNVNVSLTGLTLVPRAQKKDKLVVTDSNLHEGWFGAPENDKAPF